MERLEDYLETVGAQLRWKRTRLAVLPEIRRHLEDQREVFEQNGASAAEAARLTIEDMGDPVELGVALDRVHRPKSSWGLLLLAGLSCCIWLGWQIFSHMDYAYGLRYSLGTGLVLLLGAAVMLGLYFADYTLLGKLALPLSLGMTVIAFWNVTPVSSHMPLVLPMALALAAYALRGKGWAGAGFCVLLGLVQLLAGGLTLYAPVNFQLFLCNSLLLLLVLPKSWFGLPKGRGVCLGLLFVALGLVLLGWRVGAFFSLSHWRLAHEVNTQWLAQAKLFGRVESAELLDRLSNGRGLLDWDYGMFLHWVLLRFGWVAFSTVQLPTLGLLAWGWRKCLRLTTVLGRLLGETALLIFSTQALLYLTQTLAGLPLSAYPYPFLNSGGAALVLDFALLGILLSVFRGQSLKREPFQQTFRQSTIELLESALKKVRSSPAGR